MSNFKIRQRLKKRVNKTKLNLYDRLGLGWAQETSGQIVQNTAWVTGNTTALMESATNTLDIGVTVGCASYSAKAAGTNLVNGIFDYAAGEYGSLCLDCVGFCCDGVATAVAFLPKNNLTIKTFAGCSAVSKFTRTVRNKYKETKDSTIIKN